MAPGRTWCGHTPRRGGRQPRLSWGARGGPRHYRPPPLSQKRLSDTGCHWSRCDTHTLTLTHKASAPSGRRLQPAARSQMRPRPLLPAGFPAQRGSRTCAWPTVAVQLCHGAGWQHPCRLQSQMTQPGPSGKVCRAPVRGACRNEQPGAALAGHRCPDAGHLQCQPQGPLLPALAGSGQAGSLAGPTRREAAATPPRPCTSWGERMRLPAWHPLKNRLCSSVRLCHPRKVPISVSSSELSRASLWRKWETWTSGHPTGH